MTPSESPPYALPAAAGRPVALPDAGGDGHPAALPSWRPIDAGEHEAAAAAGDLPVRRQPQALAEAPPPLFPPPPTATEARWALYDRLDLLSRGRWWIAGIAAAVCLLTLAVALLAPRTYEAYAILLINQQQPALDAAAEFAPVPGLEERKLLNQALILQQSPEIAERTARRLTAGNAPLALAARLDDPGDVDALARLLQTRVVRVDPEGEQLDAVRITARAASAAEAALVARVYTEEYVQRARETSSAALVNASAFLDSQLAERAAELERVEAEIQRFEAQTGSVDIPQQAAARIGQVAQLEAALDRARVEQQLRGAAVRSVESELSELQPNLRARMGSGTEQELQQVYERIAEIEGTVEQVYRRNPDIRGQAPAGSGLADRERQLAELRAERERLANRYVDEVVAAGGVDLTNAQRGGDYLTELRRRMGEERVALAGAQAEITALEARLAEARGALGAVPARSMQLVQLRRQQEAAERMVLYLTERAQQTRIAAGADFGLAQVVRPAQEPERPAGRGAGMSLAIALFFGLLLGVAAAAARHRLDGRLYSPRDLAARGLNVLGVIPRLADAGGVITARDPLAPAAEAFRHLHAQLRRGPGGPRPQAVVVAGAERGAGASTVAANLAVAAAQGGLRTLLVDADLRQPVVRERLGLTDEVGAGQHSSPLAYWTTPSEHLFALTTREGASRDGTLWSQETVRELLMRSRAAFDLIVVDAPPALLAADTSVIASQTDAVLLVARAGESHGDALLQAAAELHAAGGELIGAVLTGFHADLAHGYRRTFGYRHSHHSDA
jgi:polysaccharide biosynthesis transport protein